MRTRKAGGGHAILIVAIAAIFVVLVYMGVTRGSNAVGANKSKLYDDVMALDFEADYPQNPDTVLEKYSDIDRFLSGNTIEGFTNSDLEALVEKQRMLLHPELLEINSFEIQVNGYVEKIDYLAGNDLRITQVVRETPIFSEDAKRCSIGAKQYWSKNLHINLVYNLKKEEDSGKWKIIGWYINEQNEETE